MTSSLLSRLRFVKYSESSTDKYLQLAVKAVQDGGGEICWTNVDLVNKDLIYVLGNFDSSPFKKIAGNARVVGPMVVLAVIKSPLMHIPTNPVFTMAMHGCVVCCTQTGGRETRIRIQQLVKLMGGKFNDNFTRNVTHLVAGQVGSTKYKVARKLRIPVLKPSWVETCWEQGMEELIDPNQEAILSTYKCPVLSGCVITGTGFSLEDRGRLQQICQENGAEYTGQLVRDSCTHLIVGNKQSEKYRRACQWQVVCVSMQWVHDSVDAGYCLDEDDYDMSGKQDGGKPAKQTSNDAAPSDWSKELDEFVVPSSSVGCSFLDGCKIYMCGFSDLQLEKLCKLVNYGGGVRYGYLSELVSHVVMGAQQSSEVTAIMQLNNRPVVVQSSWLLECCRRQRRVREDDHISASLANLNKEESTLDNANIRKRKTSNTSGPNSKKHNKAAPLSTIDDDNDDLMSQYQDAKMPGVLSGKTISISSRFPSSAREAIISEVTKHGGTVVSSHNLCTYYLAPLAHDPTHQLTLTSSSHMVTMLWLERCLESNTLLLPSSHFLFTPLPCAIADTLLSNCVLTISQYSGLEREHLVRLGRSLGASVQDCFARYPSDGMLATTHLILCEPTGEKYKYANLWGVPAVRDSWLFACAETQQVAAVDEHSVSTAACSMKPEDCTTNSRRNSSAGKKLATGPTGHGLLDTAMESEQANVKTPLKSFHPQFDVKDAMEGLPSQIDGPNTQMANMFNVNMEKALETVTEFEKKAETRESALKGVTICVSRKLSPQQAELHNLANSLGARCQWSFNSSQCTHYLYQGKQYEATRDRELQSAKENGCYTVSHHWLLACSESGVREDEALFPCNYNPHKALSLSTCKSSPSSSLRMGRRHSTSEQDTQLSCQQEKENEMEQNEKETIVTQQVDQEEEEEEEKEEEEEEKEEQVEESSAKGQDIMETNQGGEELRRQIQQIMENTGMNQKRMHTGPLLRRPPPASPAKDRLAKKSPRRTRKFHRSQQSLSSCDSILTDSQVMTVTYDDPQGREERQKLLAKIRQVESVKASTKLSTTAEPTVAMATSIAHSDEANTCEQAKTNRREEKDAASTDGGVAEVVGQQVMKDILPSNTPVPPPLNMPIVTHCKPTSPGELLYDEQSSRMKTRHSHVQHSVQHRFLLSSLNAQEKADFGALIQELGGVYLDSDHFIADSTHLIVGRSSRTEKYLGACASGKWVLNKSYMEACRAKGSFVEEEAYEWRGANPAKKSALDDAPRKWRLEIANRRHRGLLNPTMHCAFAGWKVLLCVEQGKMSGLRRVLEAGGAEVVSHSNVAAVSFSRITKAFINMSILTKDPHLSLEQLVQHKVLCLKPDYIAEFLQREPDPKSQQHILPEAWQLMNT